MFESLRQTRTQGEADLLISRLRAAGLHPADLRVWPHVTLAGGDLFFSVDVPGEETDVANQIIRAKDADSGDIALRATSLGALRLGVFLLIAMIAAGMLLP